MQSLILPAKLFCDVLVSVVLVSVILATVILVSISPTFALAQVYQVQPDGSLIDQPRYTNPNLPQRNIVPPIYPGQIINGERVISSSASALTTINTVSTDALPNETPKKETHKKTKSSIAQKEKNNPPQEEMLTLTPQESDAPQSEALEEALTLDQPKIDEDILAEIKQIRDQLGGGISETLKDIAPMPHFGPVEIESFQNPSAATANPKTSTQELFNEELRSLMSQQQHNGGAISEQAHAPVAASSSNGTQITAADRTQQLRTCARELEQIAGRLETIEAYQHADQLRRQAAEIWITARKQ